MMRCFQSVFMVTTGLMCAFEGQPMCAGAMLFAVSLAP
jgi:hypothetical protein